MKAPFFSIIIPTYNRAHTIRMPVDSVLRQTFTDWELIIVDDGSTDDTKTIIENYSDPRIRYVWQENQGQSAAQNCGIQLSEGEWICLQDSDDYYLDHFLETMKKEIDAKPEYKIHKGGLIIMKNGKSIRKTEFIPFNKYDACLFECFTAGSYKRDILKKNLFNIQYSGGQDLDFLMRLKLNYEFNIIHDWFGINNYNESNHGFSGSNAYVNIMNKIKCLTELLHTQDDQYKSMLTRKLIIYKLALVRYSLKNDIRLMEISIKGILQSFWKYPIEFILTLSRICYVLLLEKIGFKFNNYRF
jgi:glycosyltransferase involved in cell wall biosynthesis